MKTSFLLVVQSLGLALVASAAPPSSELTSPAVSDHSDPGSSSYGSSDPDYDLARPSNIRFQLDAPAHLQMLNGRYPGYEVDDYDHPREACEGATIILFGSGVDVWHQELAQNLKDELLETWDCTSAPSCRRISLMKSSADKTGTNAARVATGSISGVCKYAHLISIKIAEDAYESTDANMLRGIKKARQLVQMRKHITKGYKGAVASMSHNFLPSQNTYAQLEQAHLQGDFATFFGIETLAANARKSFCSMSGAQHTTKPARRPGIFCVSSIIYPVTKQELTRAQSISDIAVWVPGKAVYLPENGVAKGRPYTGAAFDSVRVAGVVASWLGVDGQWLRPQHLERKLYLNSLRTLLGRQRSKSAASVPGIYTLDIGTALPKTPYKGRERELNYLDQWLGEQTFKLESEMRYSRASSDPKKSRMTQTEITNTVKKAEDDFYSLLYPYNGNWFSTNLWILLWNDVHAEVRRQLSLEGKTQIHPPVFFRNPTPKFSPTSESTFGDRSPSSGYRSPSSGDRSPSSGDRSPLSGDRSPSSGDRSPSSGDRSPLSGDRSPSSGDRSPSSHAGSPPSDGDRPLSYSEDTRPVIRLPPPQKLERGPKLRVNIPQD